MIQCSTLTVRNVRSVADATINPSPAGVTALTGRVGAGKSTMLTALVWCLYGEVGGVPGLLTQADMRRRGSTGPVEVTATFTAGAATLTATRVLRIGRNGKETASAALTIDGVKQPKVSPTRLTRIVEQLTGLTGRAFCGAYFIAQGNLPTLAEGTPAEIQKMLEEQTGLTSLTKKVVQARGAAREAHTRAEGLPGSPDDVAAAQEQVDKAQQDASDLWPQLEEANSAAADAASAAAEARSTRDDLTTRQQRTHQARVARARAEEAHSRAAEHVESLTTRLTGAPTADPDQIHGEAQELREAIAEAEHQRADLTERRQAAEDAAESATAAADAVARLQSPPNADGAAAAVARAAGDVATARAEWTRLAKSAAQLKAAQGSQCPTCTQPLEDPTAVLASVETAMQQTADRGAAAATQHTLARQHAEEVRVQTAAYAQAEADLDRATRTADGTGQMVEAAEARLTSALRHLAELIGVDHRLTEPNAVISAAQHQVDTLTQQAAAAQVAAGLRTELASWQNTVTTTATALTGSAEDGPTDEDVNAAARAAAAADTVKDTTARAAADLNSQVGVLSERARAAEAERDRQQTLWDTRNEAITHADTLTHAHEMLNALRKELVAEYTATIAAEASAVMADIGGGDHVGVHLDAEFAPAVVLHDGSTRPLRVLSGGEKVRAALCLRLGIAEQIGGPDRAGTIWADEITASLDDEGSRAVLTTIEALDRPVVIAGHERDLADIAACVYDVNDLSAASSQLTPA